MATVSYAWLPFFPQLVLVNDVFDDHDQNEVAVAALADGRYFAAWAHLSNTRGRVLGADATGSEFLVSSSSDNEPSVAGLTDGRAVVTFTSIAPNFDIRARLFDANGVPAGPDFSIRTSATFYDEQSDVAALANGGFVVSWTSFSDGPDNIVARTFNAAGAPVSDLIQVVNSSASSTASSVAALAGGGFVVAWQDEPPGGGSDRVFFKRFNDAGVALDASRQLIDSAGTINSDIQVAALPDGGFVVAYTDNDWGLQSLPPDPSVGTDISVRIFNGDGTPRSAFFRANFDFTVFDQDRPTITVLSNGFFVVGWRSNGEFLFQQAFDAAGSRIGGHYNTHFAGQENELAALSNGVVANVITSPVAEPGGSGTSIRSNLDELIRTSIGDATSESLVGDALRDMMSGNAGNDRLFGASFLPNGAFKPDSGDDQLSGGVGLDGLWGADGNDTLDGGLGNDGLVGGAGDDSLTGAEDDDFLFGGDFSVANGSRLAGSGADTLAGGLGRDALYGFDGNDLISGGAGNEYVEAGEGNDAVEGGADADTILGQDGDDQINGGTGFDYLYGGAGADVFHFNLGDSYDAVWDFSAPQGDKLRLDRALGVTTFAEFLTRLSGFTFEGAPYTTVSFPESIDQLQIKGIAHTGWASSMVELV
jgi:Ca2+-binding RTX toxin-like protein